MKIERKKIYWCPSKILRNISWPINMCLKYFMTSQKPFGFPSYILNVRFRTSMSSRKLIKTPPPELLLSNLLDAVKPLITNRLVGKLS